MDFLLKSTLIAILAIISYKDLKHKIIQSELVVAVLMVAIIYRIFLVITGDAYDVYIDGILGFLIGGGILLIIAIATNEGIGGGDAKLIGVIGFFVGIEDIKLIMYYAFITGGITAISLILFKKKSWKDSIPFAPFLSLSTCIVLLFT